MKTVTDRLSNALEELSGLRHPSVAKILRRGGFGVEADRMNELIAAFDEMKAEGARDTALVDTSARSPLIQQAIAIISDLVSTCELNLDEVEPATEATLASAEEFLTRLKHGPN